MIQYNLKLDFILEICDSYQKYRNVLSSIKSICEMIIPFICDGEYPPRTFEDE